MKKKFDWKSKNVLITGVHGFVASNLCKKLLKKGANVYGLHRNNQTKSLLSFENIIKFNSINYNNLELNNVIDLIVNKKIDTCFHLAAKVEVKEAEILPYQTFENNSALTLKLLEAFRISKTLKSFIFTSTDKVYGNIPKHKLPYKESYYTNAINPYEMSKLNCENICRSYSNLFSLPVVITRSCNLYGPGQLNFSAIIPSLIMSALKNKRFLPRSNGLLTRDYMFIEDWANCLIKISEINNFKKYNADVFNFGTNEPKSVIQIAEIVSNLIDKENKNINIEDFKKYKSTNEIIDQTLDSTKAITQFSNFNVTRLEVGIKKTIDWYKKYL